MMYRKYMQMLILSQSVKNCFMILQSLLNKITSVTLSKRKEFVLITVVLTGGLVAAQLIAESTRYWTLLFLTVSTYAISALGLREQMKGIKWVTLLALPTLFTAAVGLFYFLLPVRWLTRLPVATLYAVGIYAILLVENIYSVAVNRSIQLLRVAHAVGFLVTLVTIFLLLNTLYSLRLESYINIGLVALITMPLVLQSLWSIKLDETIDRTVLIYSIFVALLLSEVGYMISFWPLKPIIISIFLTTISYALIGICQHYFAKRLFKQNIIEYVQVVAIVTVLILITTRYR
ncbi:MAG: hypothetical protein UU14_C0012G0018 [Candidatus Roizmanbacteria bacterium GW2011_GWB1_40_7]|uniref:Uncharacterized protein n=3 Tax=Candidatus Roizmaniibacteriota TaxID=1752723 RepID=A0A0G0T4T0_9BACT|nr:MAG: hypothetical protein UT85_C0003G0038 [Candidatus Levybacteria bacterium GW2011_GWA2_40_16]KKR72078.1 MAG: hypothetical protein UU14_C0012G0018 [Candidatus Roizmanbacteria bacterium GW2011_GWB1_40_7]KKR94385.1 MAG: hypothetical protein UU41_C0007G0018 [Candidatus Roizmanbacteria bacterium GW2011_GWA1_41_13]